MYIDPELSRSITREIKAPKGDLFLLLDDRWLPNTEVKSIIYQRKGRWHVDMLFLSLEDPLKIIIRKIDHYHSQKKAETFASIFQRGIRKDARGTLKRQEYAYDICKN